MTVYYPGHTDNLAVDYTIGTVLILVSIVSTTLNPLSFLYHIQRDSKLSSRLYALLALLDFIANVYSPLYHAYNFLKDTEDVGGAGEATVHASMVQGVMHSAAWLSQIMINVVICVRWFTLKFTFRRVRQKFVWACLSCYSIILVAMEMLMVGYYGYWYSELQLVSSEPKNKIEQKISLANRVVVIFPAAIIYVMGGVSSVLTVILLTCDKGPIETRKQRRKSVKIILTLSLINWTIPVAVIYTTRNWPHPDEVWSISELVRSFFIVTSIKYIVSTLDPIIILVLSNDLRLYIKGLLKKWHLEFSSIFKPSHHACDVSTIHAPTSRPRTVTENVDH